MIARRLLLIGTWLVTANAFADEPAPGLLLYKKHCLACHQADGGGVPNMQPAIVGGTWVKGDAQALALFLLTGGFDSASRKESDVGNVMPPFRQLANEDLAAILTYIRQKFGGGGSPVSAADVSAARDSDPESQKKKPEPGSSPAP